MSKRYRIKKGKDACMDNRIVTVDPNYKFNTDFYREDMRFYDIWQEPFHVHGLLRDEKGFCRMPDEIARKVNTGVHQLNRNTAGGRIRFATDSAYVGLRCRMAGITRVPHMAMTGSCGFDLSADGVYYRTFLPPLDLESGYDSRIDFPEKKMREIEIRFPLYSDVTEVHIALQDSARVCKAHPYQNQKPIVFYGSSITQGGCVCRPGLSYPAILSAILDSDYRNLGFSGSALGEEVMAEYLAALEMSVFVLDYDHNVPDAQYLEETHERFFQIIRSKYPNLPILLISRPDFRFWEGCEERRAVIEKTYRKAKAEGDLLVWYLDGETLWGDADWDLCSVDGIHPNDLGHYRMAQTIAPVLRKMLKRQG